MGIELKWNSVASAESENRGTLASTQEISQDVKSLARRLLMAMVLYGIWTGMATNVLAQMQSSMAVAWSPSTATNVTGYNVYYWAAGQSTNVLSVGNVTNATISSLVSGTSYYCAVTAVNSQGLESAMSNEITYTPASPNPPTITAIANQSIYINSSCGPLAFSVGQSGTSSGTLTVTGASSNPTLVPNTSIALSGSGTNWTATITPAANQTGTASITLTVCAGTLCTSTSYTLTVNALPPPTITAIANQTVNANTTCGPLGFTVGQTGTSGTSLTVTSASSNPTLVPNANIVLGGSGTSRTATITPAANQSGTATITLTVCAGSLCTSTSFTLTVNPAPVPPTITAIANQTINANTSSGPLAFSVGQSGTSSGTLTVTGASSNPTLVPNTSIGLSGSGTNWTATITPAANQSGTATVTLTVCAGTLCTSTSFTLTVNALPPPTITAIANQTINANTACGPLGFTVGQTGTSGTSLTVTGGSSNPTLVPNANIVLGGTGTSRTVAITAAANQSGTATITLTVCAGSLCTSTSFTLTVNPAPVPPTITAIANQTINANTGCGPLAFTVGQSGTSSGTLTVTGASSNPTLVPSANIVLSGSGTSWTVTVTPAANQSGTATITLTVCAGTLCTSTSFGLTVNTPPTPPTISAVANQTITANTSCGPLAFTVGQSGTSSGSLTVSAASANTTLIPNSNIVLSGSGTNWTVTVAPAANQTGTGNITLTVCAGSLCTSTSFGLTVNAPAVPPTISAIGNQTITANSTCGPLTFTVGQPGTSGAGLTVTANSSSPTMVPNTNIVLNSSGTNWTVTVAPVTNQTGTATIALTVCGAGLCTTTSFGLTVNPLATAPTAPPTITLSTTDSSTNYSAPATVNLLANVGANGHTVTQVQFYNGSTLLGQSAAAPYAFSWSSVGAGTYTLTAVVTYDAGTTVTSAPLSVSVSGLPAPWQSADVGSTGISGSAAISGGLYTVQGAGDISGSSDAFHYLYQSLTGDGEIRAQLTSVQNTGGATYVGVMIRETLTAPSSFAALGISPNGWMRWNRRNGTSNNLASSKTRSGSPPNAWVRVVRTGDTFVGYKSSDGVNWTQVSSSTITMASNIYIGLVVSSGNTSTLNTSTFSNVTVLP